jgi:hypothetical protein
MWSSCQKNEARCALQITYVSLHEQDRAYRKKSLARSPPTVIPSSAGSKLASYSYYSY